MTTRAQRESYINTLILTDNQKNKFKNSNLNVNTIQNVVNALRGKGDRNVRINGILNSLSNGNRGPLNTLLRQNTQSARKQNTPTPNQNTQSARKQNTPTPTQNTTRPMNNTNRNALKRERPNKANNINKIYKYPYLHTVWFQRRKQIEMILLIEPDPNLMHVSEEDPKMHSIQY